MSEQEKKCCCENKECEHNKCESKKCECCCHSCFIPVTIDVAKGVEQKPNFADHEEDALCLQKVSRKSGEGTAKLSVKFEDLDIDENNMTLEQFDKAETVTINKVLAEFAEGETEKEIEFQFFDICNAVFTAEGSDLTMSGIYMPGLLGEEEEDILEEYAEEEEKKE